MQCTVALACVKEALVCLKMEPHSKASRFNSQFIAGIKPGAASSGVTGPTSQIPGLSQTADQVTPVERISGRRVGIFESDSDYVKLAKGGGHKGEVSFNCKHVF